MVSGLALHSIHSERDGTVRSSWTLDTRLLHLPTDACSGVIVHATCKFNNGSLKSEGFGYANCKLQTANGKFQIRKATTSTYII